MEATKEVCDETNGEGRGTWCCEEIRQAIKEEYIQTVAGGPYRGEMEDIQRTERNDISKGGSMAGVD